MLIAFSGSSLKILKKAFLESNLIFFVLNQFNYFDNLDGADLSNFSLKILKIVIFGIKLKVFLFS